MLYKISLTWHFLYLFWEDTNREGKGFYFYNVVQNRLRNNYDDSPHQDESLLRVPLFLD